MKKSEVHAIGYLIVLAVVLSFFPWLYKTIGLVGIIILAMVVIVGLIFYSSNRKKVYLRNYSKAVLSFLHTRLTPDEKSIFFQKYSKSDFNRWSLLSCLQIMRDSIDIALSSKKRDTAESRMELAEKKYREIHSEHKCLLTPDLLEEINNVYKVAQSNFNTVLFLNVSPGHIEKSDKLKTAKSKLKYLTLALDVLDEGIKLRKGDIEELEKQKQDVVKKLAILEYQ